MKYLKIILTMALVLVMCSGISLGIGTIESSEKTVYICPEPEEPTSLDEWFVNLSIREKVDVYVYWTTRVYTQPEIPLYQKR